MAKCPKCSVDIDTMATVCPQCAWAFPAEPVPRTRTSWAYSPLARLALVIGMVAALLWAGAGGVKTVTLVLEGELLRAVFDGALQFFVSFAMFVVFARVSDSEP